MNDFEGVRRKENSKYLKEREKEMILGVKGEGKRWIIFEEEEEERKEKSRKG